jgi:hypothetical protein
MIISDLQTPIQFFNVQITKIGWVMTYPDNIAYYQLLTSDYIKLKEGHCQIDNSVVQQWGTDDSIITDEIISLEPWNIPTSVPPGPEEEVI